MPELYQHQKQMIERMLKTKRTAVWAEMGTGKSAATLKAFEQLKIKDYNYKMLIVAPNHLKHNWLREVQLWTPRMRARIVEGTPADKAKAIASEFDLLIINYESFRIYADEIAKRKCQVMVCDESQSLAGRKSSQTKEAWAYRRKVNPEYIWLLSGTPVRNTFDDFYGQYRLIMPDAPEFRTHSVFENQYLIKGGYMSYKVIGHKNEDHFRRVTDPVTIRLRKDDCLDLPEKIYEIIPVEMSEAQAKAYEQMRKESVLLLEGADEAMVAQMAVTQLMRLQQICNGFCGNVTEEGDHETHVIDDMPPKLKMLLELVGDMVHNNQQVIIWSQFRYDIAKIVAELRHIGISCEPINGEVAGTRRDDAIMSFQKGDIDVLVVQNSITSGFNATAASNVIYYGNSYSYANRMQSEDRAHRIGQTKRVLYLDFITVGTVEQKIKRILEQKASVASIIDKNSWREFFLEGGKE